MNENSQIFSRKRASVKITYVLKLLLERIAHIFGKENNRFIKVDTRIGDLLKLKKYKVKIISSVIISFTKN